MNSYVVMYEPGNVLYANIHVSVVFYRRCSLLTASLGGYSTTLNEMRQRLYQTSFCAVAIIDVRACVRVRVRVAQGPDPEISSHIA
ncbi:hypothetical protein J6590_076341 [Homalodisca vitripennis]|nr:hypothetical protein J6590_076341 [Homalodisca vitripennis]